MKQPGKRALPNLKIQNQPQRLSATRRQFLRQAGLSMAGFSLVPAMTGCIAGTSEKGSLANLYIGTYTSGDSKGIYKYLFDQDSGEVKGGALVAKATNPSFLAIHPTGNWLYAVEEVVDYKGEKSGAVHAYSIAPDTGELLALNAQPSLGGAPCHISVDATGKWVLLANYVGGNAAVYPIEAGGVLGEAVSIVQHEGSSVNERRQKGPHAHSITLDPQNRRAVVADLGIDKLMCYDFSAESGALTPAASAFTPTKPGAGPRHFAFHSNGKNAFVINELDSTITAYVYDDETGALQATDTVSTLPAGFAGDNSTADIHVSSDGRFVYGSNRGHDSIVIASFDETSGELEVVGHESTRGKTPRNFTLDPAGNFLLVANQNSNSIFVFKVNKQTGLLSSTGQRVEVPSPVCLKFA